jgi:hypothetical protein
VHPGGGNEAEIAGADVLDERVRVCGGSCHVGAAAKPWVRSACPISVKVVAMRRHSCPGKPFTVPDPRPKVRPGRQHPVGAPGWCPRASASAGATARPVTAAHAAPVRSRQRRSPCQPERLPLQQRVPPAEARRRWHRPAVRRPPRSPRCRGRSTRSIAPCAFAGVRSSAAGRPGTGAVRWQERHSDSSWAASMGVQRRHCNICSGDARSITVQHSGSYRMPVNSTGSTTTSP